MPSQKITGLRPDLTLAQLVALVSGGVPVVLQLLVAFAVFEPDAAQTDALNTATQWLGLMAIGLFGGDAAIRVGRNVKDGKVEAAALERPKAEVGASLGTTLGSWVEPVVGATYLGRGEWQMPPAADGAKVSAVADGDEFAAAVRAEGLPTDAEEFVGRPGDTRPSEERAD